MLSARAPWILQSKFIIFEKLHSRSTQIQKVCGMVCGRAQDPSTRSGSRATPRPPPEAGPGSGRTWDGRWMNCYYNMLRSARFYVGQRHRLLSRWPGLDLSTIAPTKGRREKILGGSQLQPIQQVSWLPRYPGLIYMKTIFNVLVRSNCVAGTYSTPLFLEVYVAHPRLHLLLFSLFAVLDWVLHVVCHVSL